VNQVLTLEHFDLLSNVSSVLILDALLERWLWLSYVFRYQIVKLVTVLKLDSFAGSDNFSN
jgi:hypothetical protein